MLELCTFPVEKVVWGSHTRWHDRILEIDRRELLSLVLEDDRIAWGDLVVVSPGDKARTINVYDVVEPRVKAKGPGVVYPGVCGRPGDVVGKGRTHRLGGVAVVGCVDASRNPPDDALLRAAQTRRGPLSGQFADMSGRGAVTFLASLHNICLVMEPAPDLSTEYWHDAVQSAIFRLNDRLAQTTVGLEPPEMEVFDNTPKPGLPGVVFVLHLWSRELYRGAYTKVGTAVYGITRVTSPWLLSPTEMLDGAISQQRSWIYTNNPVVLELFRRHGKDWNFLACLAYPTNWGMEAEKEVVSNRLAEMARMLGAQGAIVTNDVRGQRMIETMLSIKALERAGIKTVFITEEEDPEDGEARAFLTTTPELVAVVSTGTGGCPGPFPAVDQVIGSRDVDSGWFQELPPVHGRYARSHLMDNYGYGKQSYADF